MNWSTKNDSDMLMLRLLAVASILSASMLLCNIAHAQSNVAEAKVSQTGENSPIVSLHSPSRAGKNRSIILALDTSSNASSTKSQQSCDAGKMQTCENLVQDNILWNITDPDSASSKHWLKKNLDDLCACTTEPYETVNCFQVQVNNKGKTWQEAISICHAKP